MPSCWRRWRTEETGLGRAEDKVKKNRLVIDKTPGPEILQPSAWTGDRGLTLVERAPYGVFGVITPSTNPTSTIINNAIGLVSAGNAAVFNVHPGAQAGVGLPDPVAQPGDRRRRRAARPALTALAEPTVESAQALMKHPGIRILLITGGGAVVKLAMASGKRAICAGPGNPPVVVDETADIDLAGRRDRVSAAASTTTSSAWTKKRSSPLPASRTSSRRRWSPTARWSCPRTGLKALEKVIFEKFPGPREHGVMKKEWIGQNAGKILSELGISCPRRPPDPGRDAGRSPADLDRAVDARDAPRPGAQRGRGDRPRRRGRAWLRPYGQHVQPEHRRARAAWRARSTRASS